MRLTAHDPHPANPRVRRGRSETQALDAMLADIAAFQPIEPDARAECDATRVELATAKAAAELDPVPTKRPARRQPGPFDLVIDELSRRFHDLPGGRQRIRREVPDALFTCIRKFTQAKETGRA